jgi:hypothetical protein
VTVADEVHGDFDWLWMQAPVDSAGPVVAILAPQGYAPTRPVLIVGSATDDAGVPRHRGGGDGSARRQPHPRLPRPHPDRWRLGLRLGAGRSEPA